MSVVDDSFGYPLRIEEKATMSLAGGIANMGYQCGMLWGAALAAGAQAYRLHGFNPQAEVGAIIATQRLVDVFRTHTKNEINCLEISELDMQGEFDGRKILKFFIKGGPIGCFRLAARYAPYVRREIDSANSEKLIKAPSPPVSCASLLAKKMGASDMYAVMTAGLAGGIGLSGGACGALGTAIWIHGMKKSVKMDGFSYSGTWIQDTIEKFLETSDYEFECDTIVGHKFESLDDHATYLRAGGCSGIIEGLAGFSSTKK